MVRHVDDIIILNQRENKNLFNRMYRNELTLTINDDQNGVPFLDVLGTLNNNKMVGALHNKTNGFKVKVIKFIQTDCNVSDKFTRTSLLLSPYARFIGMCSELMNFIVAGKYLLKTCLNRGLNSNLIGVMVSKTSSSNTLIFSKFMSREKQILIEYVAHWSPHNV